MFLLPSLTRLPYFEQIISRLATNPSAANGISPNQAQPDPVVVDIGTCFGQDLRLLAMHGVSTASMWAIDKNPALWKLGYELFRDAHKFEGHFIECDFVTGAEDEARQYGLPYERMTNEIRYAGKPDTKEDEPEFGFENINPNPTLAELLSASKPLHHGCSVIITNQFLHLFSLPQQTIACVRIAKLLSQQGTLLVGYQQGRRLASGTVQPWGVMFLHNADSWRRMWRVIEAITGQEWEVQVREVDLAEWGMLEEDVIWMPEDRVGIDYCCRRIA